MDNNINLPNPPTTLQLQADVQDELANLNAARLGVIEVLHAHAFVNTSTIIRPDLTFDSSNILQTIQNMKHCPNVRIYIDVPIHDANGNTLTNKHRIEHLSKLLKTASIAGGDVLVRDGLGRQIKASDKRVLWLRCQCCFSYRGNKITETEEGESSVMKLDYRKSSFVNDKRNGRMGSNGTRGPKKKSTIRRIALSSDFMQLQHLHIPGQVWVFH